MLTQINLFACLTLLLCPIVGAQTTAELNVSKETLVYKQVGPRDLRIHVTKPADWKPTDSRPAVLFFHGGGWTGGKPGQFDDHCQVLAKRGIVCFQVEYRLLKKGTNAPPMDCIHDAKSSLRWVRSRAAEFGIAADKIATSGGSAGGHLAAFLGTTDGVDDPQESTQISARSNAMLLFNPVYDNGPDGWGTGRVGDQYKTYSPAHNLSGDDAPAIVFLGTHDQLIPVATAQRFQNEMHRLGVRSDLRLYADAGHGFFNANKNDGKYFQLTINETIEFLVSLGWIDNP